MSVGHISLCIRAGAFLASATLLIMGGCSAATREPSGSTTAAASARAAQPSSVTTTPAATSQTDPLTGFGALVAVWRSLHAEDPGYAPGMSYDNNRFGAVLELDGRILGFDINLPPNTPIETARAAARHELPPDTTVVWSKTLAECVVE
jgi:hypothetical protein